MTPQDVAKAVELYAEGHSIRRVAVLLGTADRKAVAAALRDAGVDIRHSWRPVEWVGDLIKCSVCGETKDAEGFIQKYPDGRVYHLSFCRDCKSKKARLWYATSRDPWTHRIGALRGRARAAGIEMTLSAEWAEETWQEQHGLCFYTDLPMTKELGKGRSPESVSFDRIVPDLGYTPANTVLCQARINTIKSDVTTDEMRLWMPEWHRRLELRASRM